MLRTLHGLQKPAGPPEADSRAEVSRLFKREIAEGIFEITEPYSPEAPAQAPPTAEKREVVGFDDFFGKPGAPAEETGFAEVDRILGIKKAAPGTGPKEGRGPEQKPGPKSRREAGEAPAEPTARGGPSPGGKAEASPGGRAEPPALSVFKRRMLARRKQAQSRSGEADS